MHGLNETATALALKYDSLKKHIEATGAPMDWTGGGVRSEFSRVLLDSPEAVFAGDIVSHLPEALQSAIHNFSLGSGGSFMLR